MKIEKIVVGPLQTNCYLLAKNNEVIIVDPGDDFPKIKSMIGNRKVISVFITHYHSDHIGALNEVKKYYKIDNINPKKITNFDYEILLTPGHKEDAITIYFPEENCMFCGDFIFLHSIGRMDLPGGNRDAMKKSLLQIKNYPKETILYPGHGPRTTLKEEELYLDYYIKSVLE